MAKRDKTEDLVKELTHEEDWKRMNATAELLKRGPEAVRHLLAVLADENPRVRAEAAHLLGRTTGGSSECRRLDRSHGRTRAPCHCLAVVEAHRRTPRADREHPRWPAAD